MKVFSIQELAERIDGRDGAIYARQAAMAVEPEPGLLGGSKDAVHIVASVLGIATFVVTYVSTREVDKALYYVGGYAVLIGCLIAGVSVVEALGKRQLDRALGFAVLTAFLAWLAYYANGASQTTFSDVQALGVVAFGWLVFTIGRDYAEGQRKKWKVCPACSERVRANAQKCRYCQHEFSVPDASTASSGA